MTYSLLIGGSSYKNTHHYVAPYCFFDEKLKNDLDYAEEEEAIAINRELVNELGNLKRILEAERKQRRYDTIIFRVKIIFFSQVKTP